LLVINQYGLTLNGSIYVYDLVVLKKRPHLEIVRGEFIDGEFFPEAPFPSERSQTPDTPIVAVEYGAGPGEEMDQVSAEAQEDNEFTPKS